jgi:hypothetical protein
LPSQSGPKIVFDNIVERSGITYQMHNSVTPQKHQVETMVAGVAVFDYNNDGLPHIYFVNGAKLPEMDKLDPAYHNRLYRNNGDGTFTDVTEKAGLQGAGYGMGVAAGDYDNDGFEDLYIASVNRNQLFHNNGDGTFTDVTAQAGVAGVHPKFGKTWGISAGWFDYDNDGLLDLIVINYANWSLETEPPCKVGQIRAYCSPNSYTGQPDILYHKNGDGTFTDVSVKSGIDKLIGKGMGVEPGVVGPRRVTEIQRPNFDPLPVSRDQKEFRFHVSDEGFEWNGPVEDRDVAYVVRHLRFFPIQEQRVFRREPVPRMNLRHSLPSTWQAGTRLAASLRAG